MNEEVAAAEKLEKELTLNLDRLESFGVSLSKTLAEDINARRVTGIEDRWIEDQEFFDGIDDRNRAEEGSIRAERRKPADRPSGAESNNSQSTVFPNITAPFVEAAVSRLADVLLPPISNPTWDLEPTPIPELVILAAKAKDPMPPVPEEDKDQFLKEAETLSKTAAGKAKKRINDWHIQCRRNAEVRKAIEDAGKIGTGILKGPFSYQRERVGYLKKKLVVHRSIDPATKRVDPWNFFPSKDCGEHACGGDHVWERDFLTKKQVFDLLKDETYIKEQLALCLVEGPKQATTDTVDPFKADKPTSKFEVWYYYGVAEKADFEAAGHVFKDDDATYIPAMLTLINGHVVRFSLNALDTGAFPYHVFSWRPRGDSWAGIGVARQIRAAQKIVTGGTRVMMENAGVAAGPMIVFKRGSVYPANGTATVGPWKIWYIGEDADSIADARQAIGVIKVDMLVNELMAIIEFGLRLAESTTGLPMLLQGQMGNAPDTVGGMKLLYNNTAAPLRRLARQFDDAVTSREIEQYYTWILQYGEDDEKGDFMIRATGSSTLVERDLQEQELGQMSSIVVNPIYGLDPKKWANEWLQSRRFDPDKFNFTDEEWQQVVESLSQPPPNPAVDVATIKAEVEQYRIDTNASVKKLQGEIEVWKTQATLAEGDLERQLHLVLASAVQETADSKTLAEREARLDDAKKEMTQLVLRLRSQENMARASAREKVLPFKGQPAEPAGKASPGRSVQE